MNQHRKLNIHDLLTAVDRRDLGWLEAQPEDIREEFVPITAMRWAAGAPDHVAGFMLWLINRRVNRYLFELGQHPDLSFRLLASCGLKKKKPLNYSYLKGPFQPRSTNKAWQLLAEQHPFANDNELCALLRCSRADFQQLLDDCGTQVDKQKAYLDAYEKLAD